MLQETGSSSLTHVASLAGVGVDGGSSCGSALRTEADVVLGSSQRRKVELWC